MARLWVPASKHSKASASSAAEGGEWKLFELTGVGWKGECPDPAKTIVKCPYFEIAGQFAMSIEGKIEVSYQKEKPAEKEVRRHVETEVYGKFESEWKGLKGEDGLHFERAAGSKSSKHELALEWSFFKVMGVEVKGSLVLCSWESTPSAKKLKREWEAPHGALGAEFPVIEIKLEDLAQSEHFKCSGTVELKVEGDLEIKPNWLNLAEWALEAIGEDAAMAIAGLLTPLVAGAACAYGLYLTLEETKQYTEVTDQVLWLVWELLDAYLIGITADVDNPKRGEIIARGGIRQAALDQGEKALKSQQSALKAQYPDRALGDINIELIAQLTEKAKKARQRISDAGDPREWGHRGSALIYAEEDTQSLAIFCIDAAQVAVWNGWGQQNRGANVSHRKTIWQLIGRQLPQDRSDPNYDLFHEYD